MTNDELIAHHEAAHVVIGDFFLMRTTTVTLGQNPTIGSEATHDRSELHSVLPGTGLLRGLVHSCVRVIQLAAGGCAELKLGRRHEDCGWGGDAATFDKHLDALAGITGRTRDSCWWFLSGKAESLLYDPFVWGYVEKVAAELLRRRTLGPDDVASCLAGAWTSSDGPDRTDELEQLLVFVTTPNATKAAEDPDVQRKFEGS